MFTVLHTESSMGWGGQEIRTVQESLGMTERGHRIIIAAPEKSIIFRRAKVAGIDTISAHFQKKNPVSVLNLISLINRERPDIINTHSSSDSWVTTIAAQLSTLRPKVIRTRHLSTPISRSFLSRLIYDILPDVIITTGEEIRQRMIHDNRFNAFRIFSIPTGIDLKRFNPENVKPSLNPPIPPFTKGGQGGLRDGFSIGMIGVLRSWKGHRFFIEAIPEILEKIPDAYFYIVGDGPQYENIKNLISEQAFKNKIFMLGYREDIPEVMVSLDLIVHPSYANEGVPQSILQAMAMEKPVIASDTGAIKEVVIHEKTGLLIPTKNPNEIAVKVIEIYKNPKLAAGFGKEGRSLVEESYSMDKMLDKIELLYRNLIRGNG
jgi:glycosyltransferase involved in cell wall biosynthesis